MNQNQTQRREQSSSQPMIPSELRAVLTILNADEELRLKALPHVSVERREINWERIFRNDFGSGHRAALLWAKSLFRDEAPAKVDPFDRAFSMDNHLRTAVINAIAIRWGVSL